MSEIKTISIEQLIQEFRSLGASAVDLLLKEYREDRINAENIYFSACRGQPQKVQKDSILGRFSELGLNYYRKVKEIPEELRTTAWEAHRCGYRERLLKQSPESYFRG